MQEERNSTRGKLERKTSELGLSGEKEPGIKETPLKEGQATMHTVKGNY